MVEWLSDDILSALTLWKHSKKADDEAATVQLIMALVPLQWAASTTNTAAQENMWCNASFNNNKC